jgi:hypothetical protein
MPGFIYREIDQLWTDKILRMAGGNLGEVDQNCYFGKSYAIINWLEN